MKRSITFFLMAALLAAAALSCSAPPSTVTVFTGKAFTLSPGQTAQVEGELLSIRFVRVVADSRCPRNVVCVRAGDVTSEVEITDSLGTKLVTIVQDAASSTKTIFNIYELTTSVEPYPVSGQTIPPLNYRMTITVKER